MEKLEEIYKLLKSYDGILNREPLEDHPHHLNGYSEQWLDELISADEEKFYEVDGLRKSESVVSTLKDYIETCHNLGKLPERSIEDQIPIKGAELRGITSKKTHELSRIKPFLAEKNITSFVDVAGGKGHLSFIMARDLGTQSTCLDFNDTLINAGKKRNNQYLKDKSSHIQFHHCDLKANDSIAAFKKRKSSVGLHTCGSLAHYHIKKAIEADQGSLLNFGCCYFTMDTKDLPLSNAFNDYPLPLSMFSLSLATRSHGQMQRKDYNFKLRVKYYRHIFQFLHDEIVGEKQAVRLRSSNKSLYRSDFATYAKVNLQRLNLSHSYSDKQLNDFFEDFQNQKTVREIMSANCIRSFLGKPLEIYLLIDRAFYLQEHGYQVSMQRFFNENISPRNIGIFAQKKGAQ